MPTIAFDNYSAIIFSTAQNIRRLNLSVLLCTISFYKYVSFSLCLSLLSLSFFVSSIRAFWLQSCSIYWCHSIAIVFYLSVSFSCLCASRYLSILNLFSSSNKNTLLLSPYFASIKCSLSSSSRQALVSLYIFRSFFLFLSSTNSHISSFQQKSSFCATFFFLSLSLSLSLASLWFHLPLSLSLSLLQRDFFNDT